MIVKIIILSQVTNKRNKEYRKKQETIKHKKHSDRSKIISVNEWTAQIRIKNREVLPCGIFVFLDLNNTAMSSNHKLKRKSFIYAVLLTT